MRNFIILLSFLLSICWIADSVLASNLQDLYTNNDRTQSKLFLKQEKNEKIYNNSYMPNYTAPKQNSYQNIIQQGSKNQGYYATTNKLRNPVRIDNPYNRLNDKYNPTPEQVYSSAIKYDGDAVKFKKGADGKLYGYNRYGQKVGTYNVNNNGTVVQYDKKGNKRIYK